MGTPALTLQLPTNDKPKTSRRKASSAKPVMYQFPGKSVGKSGLHQARKRFTIAATRSMSGDTLFTDDDVFSVKFTHMDDFQSPRMNDGKVISYQATKQLTPLAALSTACDADRDEHKLQAWEYVEFFRELEMIFSLAQVEDILLDSEKWDVLNLAGGSNIFMVMQRGKCCIVIARRIGKKWYLKDSVVGMGRGYDAGVQFIFRNKSTLAHTNRESSDA